MKIPDAAMVDQAKDLLQQFPQRASIPPRWQVAARMKGSVGCECGRE